MDGHDHSHGMIHSHQGEHAHGQRSKWQYGHHDARGNLAMIADNLILLQDHLSGANTPCGDCTLKHLETIRAYANEGMSLDSASDVMELLEKCARAADDGVSLVAECIDDQNVCRVRNPADMRKLIDSLRVLRREINSKIYNLPGDLVYQSEQDLFVEGPDGNWHMTDAMMPEGNHYHETDDAHVHEPEAS